MIVAMLLRWRDSDEVGWLEELMVLSIERCKGLGFHKAWFWLYGTIRLTSNRLLATSPQ